MRTALTVIAALVLGLLIAGHFGVERINQTERVLLRESIPDLMRSEYLSRALNTLLRDLGSINILETDEAQAELATRINGTLDEIRRRLAAGQDDIAHLIDAFEEAAERKIAGSRAAIRQSLAIAQLSGDLETVYRRQVSRIDGLVFETGAKVEAQALRAPNLAGDPAQGGDIALAIFELNSLTQLKSGIETIFELSSSIPGITVFSRYEETKSRLAFLVRSMARQLAELPDTPVRRELAADLRIMRALIIGEDGIAALQRGTIDLWLEQVDDDKALDEVTARLSTIAADLVAQSDSQIRAASQELDMAARQTTFMLRAGGILAIGLVVFIGIVIVERQIVRRLAILSDAVRHIAGGDHDHEVGVTGEDEFGEMADALEVFKTNSRELRRSNAELARFAYAASHDLRSPLRAIRDLAEWTIEDAGDTLPGSCQTNLNLLLSRVDRLSTLLGNLLDYSRLGREEASVEKIDVAKAAQEVVDLMSASGRFRLVVEGADCEIVTYAAPLRQILLNLIGNAIKHHDKDAGEIRLSIEHAPDRAIISLSDDGPGISPAYHERIFGLFETLKSRDEVEGSGMGLAIIRKLVESYGGVVSVASDPESGRGTVFRFDWPVRDLIAGSRVVA